MTALAPLAILLAGTATPAPRSLDVPQLFARPLIEGNRPEKASPSPDGKKVAFIWNAAGERSPRDLWLVDAAGARPPVNLTQLADPTPERPGSLRPARVRKGAPPQRASVDEFAWSPQGDALVFTALGDLWTVTTQGKTRRLTDTEVTESSPTFAPDGRRIAFVSGGDIWIWDLTPGAAPVTSQLTLHEQSVSFEQPLWSPRGDHLAVIRRSDSERFELLIPDYLGEKVSTSNARGGWSIESVAILATTGGDALIPELGGEAPISINALRYSPDGCRLLLDGTSRNQQVRTLHLIDLEDERTAVVRTIDREEDERWVFSREHFLSRDSSTDFSPDGRRIVFLSERSGFAQPWVLDLDVPGARPRPLGSGRFETTWIGWSSPDSLVSIDSRSAPHERRPWLVNAADGSASERGGLPGLSSDAMLSANRRLLLYSHSRFDKPSDLFAQRLPDGAAIRLTNTVPATFAAVDWVVPELTTIPAFDGHPLSVLFYSRTAEITPQEQAAVIFVHGAGTMQNVLDGWTTYSPNFKFASLLVQRGLMVAEVDYRGSAGYGREFRTGVWKHLGGRDLDDIVALARWLRKEKGVARIGIYGGSYGGFATLMALFQHPADFQAGAALRFVSDWENYFSGNPWYCTQRLGLPTEDREAYRRSSPIHFAAGLQAPLLLLHGMKDNNVHFQDAAQLTARLIDLGKPFELMIYPDEGHGFATPEGWIDGYGRVEEFFLRTLSPGIRH